MKCNGCTEGYKCIFGTMAFSGAPLIVMVALFAIGLNKPGFLGMRKLQSVVGLSLFSPLLALASAFTLCMLRSWRRDSGSVSC